MAKYRFSLGDALLCVTLAAVLHPTNEEVRLTARRIQKRLPKVNRWPFELIAQAENPRKVVFTTLKELTDEPTESPRLD